MKKPSHHPLQLSDVDKTRLTAQAALYSAPAVTLMAGLNGWMGITIGAALLAGILGLARSALKAQASLNDRFADAVSHSTAKVYPKREYFNETEKILQTESDAIAARLGEKPRPVYLRFMTHTAIVEQNAIYFNAHDVESFSPPQRAFILAHEWSHIHHGDTLKGYGDSFNVLPLIPYAGGLVPFAYQAFTSAEPSLAMAAPIFSAMGATLITGKIMGSMQYAFSREKEYRADRNALEMTGDLAAGISFFEKLQSDKAKTAKKFPDTASERLGKIFRRFEAPHPSLENRIKNLQRTARKMGLEDTAAPLSPVTPEP